jgi:hypothetical protein
MTEKNPTRVRRDMVRELGEAVLDAVRGAVCDAIRSDPSFINREMLKEAMGPHMAHAAKTIANSDEFQKAITDRLTGDLFESLKPRVEHGGAEAPIQPLAPTPEPEPEVLKCPRCDRVGAKAIEQCGRVQCPFRAAGAMPGLPDGAEVVTKAEHKGSPDPSDDLPWPDMGGSDAAE